MIRDVFPAELDAVRDLLSRANDTPYELARVAEEKCFGRGIGGEPRVRMYDDDGIAVTCGRYLRLIAVDRNRRGRGIGSALLRDANAHFIGAEAGNYFVPGVPESLIGFFRGYRETARTYNLTASTSFDPPPNVRLARADENDRVLDFVERHFGRIWRFEAARAAGIVISEHDGELAGFAAYEANNRGLGTFGPTGVATNFRRRGIGRALLLAALAELRALGYANAIIPWTDALDFYARSCGATVSGTFVTLASTR